MGTYLFLVLFALFNVALGFGAAVYLRRRQMDLEDAAVVPAPVPHKPITQYVTYSSQESTQSSEGDESSPSPEELAAGAVETQDGSLEVAAESFKAEAARFRNELLEIDRRLRTDGKALDSEALNRIAQDLFEISKVYHGRQNAAALNLSNHRNEFGDLAAIEHSLEDMLREQSLRIDMALGTLEGLDATDESGAIRAQLIEVIAGLFDSCHLVRDTMVEAILSITKAEGRLGVIDESQCVEPTTGLRNRIGLERVFDDLWHDDPSRLRTHSIAMIDIDQFRCINEEYGAGIGDRVLSAFPQFIGGMMRKNRGFDVPARYHGQRFVLVFADTGPRGAASAVERMRQATDQATFEVDGCTLRPTFCAGITIVRSTDCTNTLFLRAKKTLRAAKKEGAGTTYVDDGNGPQPLDPPQYDVASSVIQI